VLVAILLYHLDANNARPRRLILELNVLDVGAPDVAVLAQVVDHAGCGITLTQRPDTEGGLDQVDVVELVILPLVVDHDDEADGAGVVGVELVLDVGDFAGHVAVLVGVY